MSKVMEEEMKGGKVTLFFLPNAPVTQNEEHVRLRVFVRETEECLVLQAIRATSNLS